jgi:hypothetical protein
MRRSRRWRVRHSTGSSQHWLGPRDPGAQAERVETVQFYNADRIVPGARAMRTALATAFLLAIAHVALAGPSEIVPLVRLLVAPTDYQDESVMTMGVLSYRDERATLCLDKGSANEEVRFNCVVLHGGDEYYMNEDRLRKLDGEYVQVVGTFDATNPARAYLFTIRDVENLWELDE